MVMVCNHRSVGR